VVVITEKPSRMKLTRITRLRHRVFRDFAWPSTLPDFGRFNVVYGWNGSGKTTLSSLLSLIEKKTPLGDGEIELLFDGTTKVTGAHFDTARLPAVRVFNRDFIAATLASTGGIAPIYFLGEDSVEKQKALEAQRSELAAAEEAVATAMADEVRAGEKLDDFCVSQAKVLKALLTTGNSAAYNNYDKRKLRQAAQALTPESAKDALLGDDEKALLRSQKDAQPKPTLEKVAVPSLDLAALTKDVEALVGRSVVAQTLDELTADPTLATWVQRGLHLHSGEHASDTCRFCQQPLAPARRAALEAHFNDAFARFEQELGALLARLTAARQSVGALRLPEPARFYDALASDVTLANEAVSVAVCETLAALDVLTARVEAKRASPFAAVPPAENAALPESIREALAPLNALVTRHNETSAEFKASVDRACKKLELAYVAEAHADFVQLERAQKSAESALATLRARAVEIRARIEAIERAILEHQRPAEELNQELRAYLGRDELRFEVRGNGYALTRNGQPVSHLSEGERTSIAFLYFLKTLEDKKLDLTESLVVIDDPIASLDANALSSAFGYMRERTKRAGQLILLTHSFVFLRLVKSWFHRLENQRSPYPAKRPARFFQLRSRRHSDGARSSELGELDSLLRDHDSEYEYLFKRVLEEAHRTDLESLEQHYGLPSVARRLVEAFLAFRAPEMTGEDLSVRLDRVADKHGYDEAKKTRLLRVLDRPTHASAIADPERDLSLLAEIQPALRDLLDLMQTVDRDHYEGLKAALTRRELVHDTPLAGGTR
jgi:wobble nucleotide-excising tRNase